MRNIFIDELSKQAKFDERIFLVVGDLGYGIIEPFQSKFPSRFMNVGISEQNMIGFAAGLARSGYKVFVYSIANFPTFRCLEQIRNDVCYEQLDVTIVSIGAGFSYGVLGYSHFAIEDIGVMRTLPNIEILSPSDANEVRSLLKYAISKAGPKYLRLGKENNSKPLEIIDVESPIQINSGADYCVLVTGEISIEVLEAVKLMKELEKVNFDVFSIAILNSSVLAKIKFEKYSKLFTVEEHVSVGGLGSLLADFLIDNDISVNLERIHIKCSTLRLIGDQNFLRRDSGLDFESLYSTFKRKIM